jgi:hypothetical protein
MNNRLSNDSTFFLTGGFVELSADGTPASQLPINKPVIGCFASDGHASGKIVCETE